jgi:hypothetical protein
MQRFKKVLGGVAALAALAFGGAQIAGATGGSSSSNNEGSDAAITGAAADQAKAAAVKAVGGGQATKVRAENEGSAIYEVEVDNAGKTTEVTLGKTFNVIDQKADDQEGPDGEGDHADGAEGADPTITGAKADQAKAAAVKAVGGGSATSVEASDETGGGYEVKVDKAGGIHEVTLDKAFNVTKQQLDDQNDDHSDGDAETNDD